MPRKQSVAVVLLYVVCALFLLFGLVVGVHVTVLGKLLPNMEAMIGMTTDELRANHPAMLAFLFVPLRVMSALFVTLATGVFLLVRGPYREGQPGSRRIVFTFLGLFLAMALLISATVPLSHSPFPLWVLCTILTIVAFVLSKPASGGSAA